MYIARSLWTVLATTLALAASVAAQDAEPDDVAVADDAPWFDDLDPIRPVRRGIEPAVDRLLRAMSAYIAAADAFTFSIEVAEDVLEPHGQMVSYSGVADVAVDRPGSLHSRFSGEERSSRLVIHDGRCTLFNIDTNVYAITEVPKTIDGAIDQIVERYGLNIPVADIVYADPYEGIIKNVDYAYLVGTTEIQGVECHHLAFAQESIDWQVWIQVGPRPLLRKLTITYKDEEGWPNYTAHLRNWRLATNGLSPHHFEFTPPADATQAELMPYEMNESADDEIAQEEGS